MLQYLKNNPKLQGKYFFEYPVGFGLKCRYYDFKSVMDVFEYNGKHTVSE